jgi:eukaryotic-like serine/threonine-protein kinase
VSPDPDRTVSPVAPRGTYLTPGDVIGKYRIVRDVGLGGMAQVFLVHREGPEGFAKPYVIKRILPQYAQEEQFAKMFITEAKVAALLDHPNIVHVFDFETETDNGGYYLVMEYVAGASLAAIVKANRRRGTPLGQQIAVEIGVAMAHALSYAHELSLPGGKPLELVHQDVSPGNVLVSRDGAIKLADFGVVKTSMTSTEVGVVNGKWAYMSPEQISGQSVDKRSDLFSLGIVLYELVTGQRLFRAENAAATASRVMNAAITPPSALVLELEPRLDEIIMTMLERDPRARYQTAGALAADLEAVRALPQFSAGSARLRTLVRSIFPEDTGEPVLGASLASPSRASPVVPQTVVPIDPPAPKSQPSPGDITSAVDAPGRGATRLIVGIVAACVVVAALVWLAVFR